MLLPAIVQMDDFGGERLILLGERALAADLAFIARHKVLRQSQGGGAIIRDCFALLSMTAGLHSQ